MHYRNVVCLLSCSLFLSSAWGCRLDEPEHNIYQKQGKGVVYLRPYEKTNLSLPQINYKRLRLLPNLLIDPTKLEDWETVPPGYQSHDRRCLQRRKRNSSPLLLL